MCAYMFGLLKHNSGKIFNVMDYNAIADDKTYNIRKAFLRA